ncbi:hypothetical protein EV127DRAFT_121896 [Xylaria flabelliformis]|nr:hypothetical protein EV127DRAFT_121896 [Xylaria flabelliformis]
MSCTTYAALLPSRTYRYTFERQFKADLSLVIPVNPQSSYWKMANSTGLTTQTLLDIPVAPLSSPEPELQRGRKRRRDLSFEVGGGRTTIPSTESATFRGRCRYRSSSRYLEMSSLSRPTSQQRMIAGSHYRNTSASPSPSRRKLIRITQLAKDRLRSQSPSRSQSPYVAHAGLGTTQYLAKHRRQRTQSRSRVHTSVPMGFEMTSHGDGVKIAAMEALVLPHASYGIAVSGGISSTEKDSGER